MEPSSQRLSFQQRQLFWAVQLSSWVFLLHLPLPHSPHLWLSGKADINTPQHRLEQKECLPWGETLTREPSFFLHYHPPRRLLHRSSANSDEVSIRMEGKIDNIKISTYFLGRASFLGLHYFTPIIFF